MDFGEPVVRSWNDIFMAFESTKVFFLILLLFVEFILGVALAFMRNQFDWNKFFDIGKKNVIIMIAWGAAFIYSEAAGNMVYALALVYVGGSVVNNITALIGFEKSGTIGQILNKGTGDVTTIQRE